MDGDRTSPAGASAPVGLALCLLGLSGLILSGALILGSNAGDEIERGRPPSRESASPGAAELPEPHSPTAPARRAAADSEPPHTSGPVAAGELPAGKSGDSGSIGPELDQLLTAVRAGGDVSAAARRLRTLLKTQPDAVDALLTRRRSSRHPGELSMLAMLLAEVLEEPRRAELIHDLREDRPPALRLSTLAGLHAGPRVTDFEELESELRRSRVDATFLRQAAATLRSLILRRDVRDPIGRRCRDLAATLAKEAPDAAVRAAAQPLTRLAPSPNRTAPSVRWSSRKSRRRHRARRSGRR